MCKDTDTVCMGEVVSGPQTKYADMRNCMDTLQLALEIIVNTEIVPTTSVLFLAWLEFDKMNLCTHQFKSFHWPICKDIFLLMEMLFWRNYWYFYLSLSLISPIADMAFLTCVWEWTITLDKAVPRVNLWNCRILKISPQLATSHCQKKCPIKSNNLWKCQKALDNIWS